MTKTKGRELPFPKAVAARTERTVKEVNATLSRYSIEPAGTAPTARPLRVVSIAFSGNKTVENEGVVPFAFEWNVDANGVWGILAEDNLVGKTSILQVVLWALRGRHKSLTATVRNWIQHVDVTFRVDGRYLRVKFDAEDGEPSGKVSFGYFGRDRFRSRVRWHRRVSSSHARNHAVGSGIGAHPGQPSGSRPNRCI